MEEKQEYISIIFDIKPPQNTRQSIINTLILLVQGIANIEDFTQFTEIDVKVLNDNIEKAKQELDNLKIIEIKED